MNREVTDI